MKRGSWFAIGSLLATKATGAKPGLWDAAMAGLLLKNEVLDREKDRERDRERAMLKQIKREAKEEALKEMRLGSDNYYLRCFWKGFYGS